MVGHRVGGAAKGAVASSAIVGSITGAAAANVAITGTVSIPLMKREGYAPHIAGATEAAASTGGTILPPVMGVAAFVMVAITGIPYATIVLYSAIPALIYFFAVYCQIHFYALRHDLRGTPRHLCPNVGETLRAGWFFFTPLIVVVFMVYRDYSLARIALIAIVIVMVISLVNRRRRVSIIELLLNLADGTKKSLPIIVVAGPVSIMASAILLPGTGLKVGGLLIDTAEGHLFFTLAIIFGIAYLLGMGLTVVPVYVMLATLAGPALIHLGVPVLSAHLLLTWWGQASNVIPPVALASYVAAGIARASVWETGMAAVVKASALFYLPLLFVYQPALLLYGSSLDIVFVVGSIVAGVLVMSAGIEGYFGGPIQIPLRLLCGALGVALMVVQSPLVIVALVIMVIGLFVLSRKMSKRANE